MEHPDLVVAEAFGTRPEAEFAKGLLEAGGIPSMIQSDTIGGMRDHVAWSGAGFKLLVRQDDADAARDLLKPSNLSGDAEADSV